MGSRAQAQQLWCTGLVAPWPVGSSWSRAQTRVPCIGRQILNHYQGSPTAFLEGISLLFHISHCGLIQWYVYLLVVLMHLSGTSRMSSILPEFVFDRIADTRDYDGMLCRGQSGLSVSRSFRGHVSSLPSLSLWSSL